MCPATFGLQSAPPRYSLLQPETPQLGPAAGGSSVYRSGPPLYTEAGTRLTAASSPGGCDN